MEQVEKSKKKIYIKFISYEKNEQGRGVNMNSSRELLKTIDLDFTERGQTGTYKTNALNSHKRGIVRFKPATRIERCISKDNAFKDDKNDYYPVSSSSSRSSESSASSEESA